jgi:pimeloyl-ACP methyl ester carboxylesterase
VLFLHGNAENISTHFANVYWLPEHGYQVLLFDYAGYGESQGTPSVDGIHNDVARMIRYVVADTRTKNTPLFLMGQSLGGTMALYTASLPEFQYTFKAVTADAPFSSYRRIAREKLGLLWLTYLLQWPLGFLVYDGYSPDHNVPEIQVPVLLIHGLDDQTVPPHHSKRLCDQLGSNCARLEAPGLDHGKTLTQPEIRGKIVAFFENSTKS